MTPEAALELIIEHPIVPVFYHEDAGYARKIVEACYQGGLRVFEFTNRGTNALSVFTDLVRFVRYRCPGMALGIGTILTPEDALGFLDAGADFVVQPVTTAAVGELCRERDILWVPAGTTLNEIFHATQLGASLVKIFPGNVVGPAFVKAIKGPLPWLKLMVTGGVEPTTQSLEAWFGVGATAVGLGSQLFADADPAAINKRIATLLNDTSHLYLNQA
ncbi:bifunctional 4-hydroxy-2-oxoglutarate aldolase/2-dehydro-3-deoxy-phosphogluconate aldolase [Persicitalea jodogahamensis]|uniref:Bifunctional 4-hydroxy-2-oxoglutarate aldolase/2-dehydro-3-deoxy-phosphogluconate aldolase n=1 Tax=Persicitalea jodogahamensis TaxID=402147 RepID=A0A8J3D569_9BACT|nr:bifunctional 4-hydroxy-2-oxoglutarate aldolase/2-dehydro-3-deoxy-phosphogluconate aldolase [Persicitalea jodogahamensis]GHB84846.1 bifunctional 4-hydroxy-2-oxoglutarate aldolase/2-dehydro-3-deoxy-phosphogluconate aldolase [Persicitalea jodogahamensis]